MYLSKKQLILCWLVLSTLLTLVLSLAYTVVITTLPNNKTPQKLFQLSSSQQPNIRFDPQQQNTFRLSLFSRPTSIKIENIDDYYSPARLTITNIQLISITGSQQFNFLVKINTLL